MGDLLVSLARGLFFWIDRIIYSFISTVYDLLIDIAQTSVFTNDIFNAFASKVYALLGIFMLFKISFSIFTYIVDPDAFFDKSKGFSKLISNIIVTLVLLILMPWIFNQAMDIQRIILKNNIIGRIFSVNTTNNTIDVNLNNDAGNLMAFDVLSAFYHIENTGNYVSCAASSNMTFANKDDCQDKLGIDEDEFNNLEEILELSYETKNVDIYLNYDVAFYKTKTDEYVMNYIPILSTLSGLSVLLLLIVFCFDVAVRSVKIGFLRMTAPIPIISRIDPNKGKDVFGKWVKVCINTYLDLFIRLLGIYFAIFIIAQLSEMRMEDLVTGQEVTVSIFVKVFIILGTLLFAKQFPKLIEEITGIKLDGQFTFNPLKRLGETPFLGGGLAAGALLVGRTAKTLGLTFGETVGMLGRNIGAGIDNFTGNKISGFGNAASNFFDAKAMAFNGRFPNLSRSLSSIKSDAVNTFYSASGGLINGAKAADRLDSQIKALETYANFKKDLKAQADFDSTDLSRLGEISSIAGADTNLYNAARGGVKGLKQYYEDLKDSGTASVEEITRAREAWEKGQEIVITNGNASINNIKAQAAQFVRSHRDVLSSNDYSVSATASYDEINSGVKAAQGQVNEIQTSEKYRVAQARKAAMPPKKKGM